MCFKNAIVNSLSFNIPLKQLGVCKSLFLSLCNYCVAREFFVWLNFRYQALKAYFRGLNFVVCPEHVITVLLCTFATSWSTCKPHIVNIHNHKLMCAVQCTVVWYLYNNFVVYYVVCKGA